MIPPSETDRILIVNANWLGDVLFSTPAIRAIRKQFPESYLACLVPSRCLPVLKHNPHLSEVMVYNDRISLRTPFQFVRLVREIKKRRFVTAIFFHRSKTKVLLASLGGVGRRLGYAARFRERFLTGVCPVPERVVHRIDHYLGLLGHFGIPGDGRAMDFYPAPEGQKESVNLLDACGIRKGEPYAVIHAGANWEIKRWPRDHFVQWIRLFRKERDWKIILCGTAPEEEISRQIAAESGVEGVISLCGKTSFDALAVILKGARFLLSNDSGPIHLAAAMKTPVAGVFGPTSPELTGPISEGPVVIAQKDVGCEVPCYFRSCHYRVCMDLLTPEEVMGHVRRLTGGAR